MNRRTGRFCCSKSHDGFKSRMALNEAHLVQTKLIEGDAGEGKIKVSLVLVDAQDSLLNYVHACA
ncbi:PTS lactose/cellobiose transporter subunit IIA [Shigella flexneri]